MDISFTFELQGAVLGFVEGKNFAPGKDALRQTVAYSLCPLAFCRWGRWRNKEPLVSLLISPQRLYRLTFTKSRNSAFGIKLNIETTNDKAQMEYELYKYVIKYIEDYHKAAMGNFIDHESVNPLDWTPMNLKMEDLPPFPGNAERWRTPLMSKNGFLFRTSSDAMKVLREKYGISSSYWDLASGTPVFVKYLSALLDYNYERSQAMLSMLLAYSEAKRKRLADLEAAERRHSRDLKAAAAQNSKRRARIVDLLHQMKKRFVTVLGFEPSVQDPDTSESEAEDGSALPHVDAEQHAESDAPPAATATTISYVEDIVHPYIEILCLTPSHPMVVMHDDGDSLLDLVYRSDSTYRVEWRRSPEWRASFLSQVGLSAINLVDRVKLCHNDIRLPNIAVRDGRFCLIDFDFSSHSVLFQPKSAFSPRLNSASTLWRSRELEMCYSVAQIAVNVFILSATTNFSFGDVTAAESIWSDVRDEASPVDRAFQAWVNDKGDPLSGFVSAVRAASNPEGGAELVHRFPVKFKEYFVDVMRRMLVD